MSSRSLRFCVTAVGLLVVAAGFLEAPADVRGLGLLGLLGAVAVLWRPLQAFSALVGLSTLGLVLPSEPEATTAVLIGVLLLAFIQLVDLASLLDEPDLADSVTGPESPATSTVTAGVLLDWTRCAGPPWLAGAAAALAVAALGRLQVTPMEWIVAAAPLVALLAAALAIGRARSD